MGDHKKNSVAVQKDISRFTRYAGENDLHQSSELTCFFYLQHYSGTLPWDQLRGWSEFFSREHGLHFQYQGIEQRPI